MHYCWTLLLTSFFLTIGCEDGRRSENPTNKDGNSNHSQDSGHLTEYSPTPSLPSPLAGVQNADSVANALDVDRLKAPGLNCTMRLKYNDEFVVFYHHSQGQIGADMTQKFDNNISSNQK